MFFLDKGRKRQPVTTLPHKPERWPHIAPPPRGTGSASSRGQAGSRWVLPGWVWTAGSRCGPALGDSTAPRLFLAYPENCEVCCRRGPGLRIVSGSRSILWQQILTVSGEDGPGFLEGPCRSGRHSKGSSGRGLGAALLRGTFLCWFMNYRNIKVLKTDPVPLRGSGRRWAESGKSPGGGKHCGGLGREVCPSRPLRSGKHPLPR